MLRCFWFSPEAQFLDKCFPHSEFVVALNNQALAIMSHPRKVGDSTKENHGNEKTSKFVSWRVKLKRQKPFSYHETRWSPRTRMPTRMLRNRDNTYFSHFPANPLVRHPELTQWGDTLVGHPCLTLLRYALVRHSCLTLWFDTLVGHSCLTLLTWHFLLDTLVRHSCGTLLLDTSSPTLLPDTLVRHSYLTLLTWHFLLGTLLGLTLFSDTLTWRSCKPLWLDTSHLTLL